MVKVSVRYYLASIFGPEEVQKRLGTEACCQCENKCAKAAPAAPIKTKKKVIEKSTLVIEVKPCTIDTSLAEIEKGVRSIQQDGLEWSKASKQVPIAFGLMKLQLGCVIVDELVSTDDLIEKIEQLGMTEDEKAKYMKRREGDEDDEEEEAGGWVQSAEIVSFQKL